MDDAAAPASPRLFNLHRHAVRSLARGLSGGAHPAPVRTPPGRPASGARFASALVAISLVAVLSALDQTVVSTALPHIIDSLQGASLLGWVFTAYFLGATATVAVTGKLADLFGRRPVFISSIVLFAAGSLLCGVASNMPMLVAFRGLQGIGSGSIQTSALILMGDMFSPRDRGKWQVINSVGFATASALGPSVGGVLSDAVSWRWIFLLNVPVCLITIGALLYGVAGAASYGARPRIDWAGIAWSMVSIVSFLVAITLGGQEFAWTSPQIISLALVTLIGGGLLYAAERAAMEPLMPMELLRGNVRTLTCLAAFANSMVWFGLILLVPLRFQLELGASATTSGALVTPGIVLGPICSFVAGQILSRTGRYRVNSLVAGCFQLGGLLCMLLVPTSSHGYAWVTLAYVVCTVGTGFGGPTFMIVFQNAIPQRRLGAGLGLLSLFRQFGASVGTAIVGSLVGSGAVAGGSSAIAEAIHRAIVVLLLAAATVLLCAWFTRDEPLRGTISDEPEPPEAVGRPLLLEV